MPRSSAPVDPVVVFGQRVRAVRHELGWTLEELAERCGLHWTYVGQVERGKRNVTLRNIVKLAEALGVEAGELLNGLGT